MLFEWERHLAAIIVAGSHSHKKNNIFGHRMVPCAIARF
jgi:hypothetical protein